MAMIAPNRVHFRTDPQRSVVDALVKKVAQNGPRGAPLTSVAMIPPKIPEQPREGVGDAVARAIDAAREAGLDPRELAAALYMHPSMPAPKTKPATERRRLREEIAA